MKGFKQKLVKIFPFDENTTIRIRDVLFCKGILPSCLFHNKVIKFSTKFNSLGNKFYYEINFDFECRM